MGQRARSERPLIRCAPHSAEMAEHRSPQTFSVYERKKVRYSSRPKRLMKNCSRFSRGAVRESRRPEIADPHANHPQQSQLANNVQVELDGVVEELPPEVDAALPLPQAQHAIAPFDVVGLRQRVPGVQLPSASDRQLVFRLDGHDVRPPLHDAVRLGKETCPPMSIRFPCS